MKKFSEIYKEKVNKAELQQENNVLEGFKKIYGAMLDHYGLTAINNLNEESQLSFLTELNQYWSEEEGISEKGEKFLQKRSMTLNENSTAVQKKNFLKEKASIVIAETLRQTNIKYKLYDVIDEMYKQTKSSNLRDVLSPDMITTIIAESFSKTLDEFVTNINKELKESVEPKRKYFVKVKTKL
jgi:hypothetical protein